MVAALAEPKPKTQTDLAIIDCDIHNAPAAADALDPYLSAQWREHRHTYGVHPHYPGAKYPRLHPSAARNDAWPPNGGPPGSNLAFMQTQLLDAWSITYGVLNTLYGAGGYTNAEYSAAMCQALNEWQIAEWLDPEPRLRASLVVPYEYGELAAAEIERQAQDSRFVQLILVARTQELLGKRKYWPMYEAAVKHDLPIGIHFGGAGGWPITGAGWPSFYFEDHAGMPQSFQPQIISMICEGIFDRFPTLKIVLIEGGFAWLPSLMWRLDRSWQQMKNEVPHLKRPPSEYIREHFWITTQPIEEPPQALYFQHLLDQLKMNERLLFATDYPHWDFDSPTQSLPNLLPLEVKQDILAHNARELYGL